MKTIILDGNNFNDETSFYDEVEAKFTKDLNWKIGRNLDAFNDVMRGGFGVMGPYEEVKIVWENSAKSKEELNDKLFATIQEIIKENGHTLELS